MDRVESMDSVDWARRVNGTWIVRSGLAERAVEWLMHLQTRNDGRLEICCARARAMCRRRERTEDPKPWFYAGLFSEATAIEAKQFLANHRLTPACVPAMWEDAEVRNWVTGIGVDTRILLARLRQALEDESSSQSRTAGVIGKNAILPSAHREPHANKQ